MGDHTDSALACQAAAGDRDAFTELLERHYDGIYRLCARVLGNADEAADLTQEVCMSLPAKLPSYHRTGTFDGWLYRIVVNAARDALRRRRTRQHREGSDVEVDSLVHAVRGADMYESAWLSQAMHRLSNGLRLTVALVIDMGLTHAEAGEALDITEKTVSWRMHEVRRQLRALANDEDAHDA